jgi:hypothetical protein
LEAGHVKKIAEIVKDDNQLFAFAQHSKPSQPHPSATPVPHSLSIKQASKERDYKAESQQGSLRYIERVATIADNTDRIANGRTDTEWILIARALSDCPLPYQQTDETKITKRTRFDGKWVKVTYSAVRDGVPMPFGADGRFMHWLIDRAVQEGRKAKKRGEKPTRSVNWNSTYEYLQYMDATDGKANYIIARDSFRRLSGLSITIEYETPGGERGKIFPLLEEWHLPSSIDTTEQNGQQALNIDRYGFTISEPLFNQAMEYLVTSPRDIWRLMKGSSRRGALLLWAFQRAYAATGESLITWDVLRGQLWYDKSNPRKINKVMEQIATLLHVLWPGASMSVNSKGVTFDKPSAPFMPNDPSRSRVRRGERLHRG